MLSPMIILPLLITSSLATDSTPDQFRSSPYVWNASHLRFYSERKGSRITTPWTATFQLSRESTGVCYPTSGEGPQFSCSQLQSPVSLTCGGEYDFDELSGPWFSCKTWVGMPEGEERTSPRQQMLLKWRVRDVVEDKTSKTDPFQEATLEVVQAFPRPANRAPSRPGPPENIPPEDREDRIRARIAHFKLVHKDRLAGKCDKSQYADSYECWVASKSTSVRDESFKPEVFAEKYWKIPNRYWSIYGCEK